MTTLKELKSKLNDSSIYIDTDNYNYDTESYSVYKVNYEDEHNKEVEKIAEIDTDLETIIQIY